MATGHYDLKKTKKGQFYFNLVTTSGDIILNSEMYTTKAAANKGIHSVRVNSPDKARHEVRKNKSGKPYFVLKARNHQIIAISEAHTNEASMKKCMQSVMKIGPTEKVRDLTKQN
ncbi:YegP family protein [Xenorhabdus sp. DI]|uniref:YegP family protein n=1 Tax=Xenorhabdus doucetiae TaxID=351671 RepID=UPI0019CDD562|nr:MULTISPECIES: YegP family protein [unclassified Xenorhabdus]MBD2783631.1 YegP family protein [Xenorhabdus sp. 3]MBD2789696.1 YegP family protein [Xenorhabdus sp. DI]